jgi:chromosomal replication initiator protein
VAMNAWELIKDNLGRKLTAQTFQNWVVRTSFGRLEGECLWVSVPDDNTRAWLEEELVEQVYETARELKLGIQKVVYHVNVNGQSTSVPLPIESIPEIQFAAPMTQLNPKFTFDTFVVGACNQFAHAAAKAVATTPSRRYNPLFIYGGVGMGKTHLMHAIGRELLDCYSGMKIVYTSSERFMNEMITCIKHDRMSQFHRHYRSADVLLVDDIQILANKERTQEEFFHTFNELYDHQKQIVISSDSTPKSTPGLVERLRSRFEWGLMVDVQAPDLETKMAILDKKAEAEGVKLPEDVRIFIATKTKSNVRELEGSLVKIIAYASVTGTSLNLPIAQHVLKHLVNNQERKITMETVIRAVADKFGMTTAQIKQKTNAQNVAFPRQIAMYLVKEMTPASLPEIGRAFGGKHHTTVLHSVQKIEKLRTKDQDLDKTIHSLMDSLN